MKINMEKYVNEKLREYDSQAESLTVKVTNDEILHTVNIYGYNIPKTFIITDIESGDDFYYFYDDETLYFVNIHKHEQDYPNIPFSYIPDLCIKALEFLNNYNSGLEYKSPVFFFHVKL